MASSGKKKTTMAKLTRERRLQERRQDKQARKEARKRAAAETPPRPWDAPPLEEDESTDSSTEAPELDAPVGAPDSPRA